MSGLTSFFNQYRFEFSFAAIFISFYYFPDDFKLFVFVNFLLILLLITLYKNFFLSTYSVFFVSLFFLEPGKYYSMAVIRPGLIWAEPFWSEGYNMSYGLIVSDILAILLIGYSFSYILKKLVFKRRITDIRELSFLPNRLVIYCWFMFVAFGLFSAVNVTFEPIFSTFVLFQYAKIIVVFVSTLFLLSTKQNWSFFNSLLSSLLLANIFKTIIDAIFIFSPLSSIISFGAANSSEWPGIFRIPGTFLHANQFAFFIIILVLLSINAQRGILKNKFFKIITLVLLILTQSRTGWLIAATLSFFWFLTNRSYLNFSKKVINGRFILVGSSVITILIPLVIKRSLAIFSSFNGGSGSIRLEMLSQGFELYRISPLWGFGAENNIKSIFENVPNSYIAYFPAPIHTAFVQFLLEFGLMGTAFLILPFLILLKSVEIFQTDQSYRINRFVNYSLLFSVFCYYVFQPHGGRFEVPLLGLIAGYIAADLSLSNWKKNKKNA
ncbi:MAG: O-antigen ligase family protein [Patescibacteria group bacterium]